MIGHYHMIYHPRISLVIINALHKIESKTTKLIQNHLTLTHKPKPGNHPLGADGNEILSRYPVIPPLQPRRRDPVFPPKIQILLFHTITPIANRKIKNLSGKMQNIYIEMHRGVEPRLQARLNERAI